MQGRISAGSACRRSGRSCLRQIARSERGGALIEIMMSALLVALAATAVFKGIDGATATSGQSKSRAVATTLAHEDQERIRSMDPRKLASYNPAPTKKVVNRIEYTVTSDADWVSDRGDSESCTRGDGRVTYVKISSKVEWPDMRGSKPVNASSIVAINNAYAKGSLAVKVVDRTGATGVPSVPVSVDAPVGQTKQTNTAGCVVFDGLDSGAYFGEFSKLGYVDPNGVNLVRPTNGWNVTTGTTASSTYQYDLAGEINFEFDTRYSNATTTFPAWNITSAPAGTAVTVLHQNIPGPPLQGMRQKDVVTGAPSATFDRLFPFTTAYTAFAGKCAAAAPAWSMTNSAIVPPAGTATPNPLRLRMPALGFRVQRNGGSLSRDADVIVKPTNGTCFPTHSYVIPLASGYSEPSSTNFLNWVFPPGDYTVCADDRAGTSGTAQKREAVVSNTNENGQLVTINITNSSPSVSGHCT